MMSQPMVKLVEPTPDRLVIVEDANKKIVTSSIGNNYRLTELLVSVAAELIGGEYNWGKPVSKEIW